jgi:hypothetical protein
MSLLKSEKKSPKALQSLKVCWDLFHSSSAAAVKMMALYAECARNGGVVEFDLILSQAYTTPIAKITPICGQ